MFLFFGGETTTKHTHHKIRINHHVLYFLFVFSDEEDEDLDDLKKQQRDQEILEKDVQLAKQKKLNERKKKLVSLLVLK